MMFKNLLLLVSFLAACFMQAANAQVPALYGSTSLLQWQQMSALGNTVTLGADRITAINAGNYSIASGVGTDLSAVTRAKVPIGNANLVVDVVAKIPAASVAKALANVAVKLIAPIQIGVAIWDLVSELGMTASKDASGALKLEKMVPTNGITYEGQNGVQYDSWDAACASKANGPGLVLIGPTYIYGDGPYCTIDDNIRGARINGYITQTKGPAGTKTLSVSRQDFEDAIAQKSDWPTSSAIARATMDAVRSGESVTVTPQSVTGPASTPGTTTSSTTSGSPAVAPTSGTSTSPGTSGSPAVDSITTTSTTTNNYKYDGNTITVSNTTVTNITNNTTGQQQTTKTDKAPELKNADLKPDKAATPDKVEDPATDTPLGDVPKLYTPVYPRGIEGVWADQKAAMSGSSLARLVPSLMPNVGSGGQCPTMPINLNLSSWANFGTVDVAPPCFLWDFGKVVIIMSALLLARGLVFGG